MFLAQKMYCHPIKNLCITLLGPLGVSIHWHAGDADVVVTPVQIVLSTYSLDKVNENILEANKFNHQSSNFYLNQRC